MEALQDLQLDESASLALAEHLSGSQAQALRIMVEGGGCSGFQYRLLLDDPKEDDHVFESRGQMIVCDPVSFTFVRGSTIHYSDGLQEAGFQVENPNANGGCGCGSSFYV